MTTKKKKDNPWTVQTEEDAKKGVTNSKLQALLMDVLLDINTVDILDFLSKMVVSTREYYPEFEIPEDTDEPEDTPFTERTINREDAVRKLRNINSMEERHKEYGESLLPLAMKAHQFYTALTGIVKDHEAAIAKLRKLDLEKEKKGDYS